MKNLAYIPTKVDKNKLYEQLKQKIRQDERYSYGQQQKSQALVSNKKLSKEELNILLLRLTKITKKQYDTQQQTTHLLAANLELKKRRQQSQKVQNRLIDYGKRIAQKKLQMQKQLQSQMKQKYYRQIPEITQKARNVHQKSIDLRLNEIINERNDHKQSLQMKYQPLFKPTIDPHSQFINDLQNYGDLHNRMDIKQKQAIKRKESLLKKLEIKDQQQMPFKPLINQKSRQIAEKMPRKPLSIACTIKKSQNQDQKTLDLSIYPFVPQINKNTQQLLKNKKQKLDSNCFQRLYSQAKQLKKKHQQKFEQIYSKDNFKPKINERSLKMIDRKTKNRQSACQGSFEQYEQIKIGVSDNQTSRAKCYSLKNLPQKDNKYGFTFKEECLNILNRGNRMRMSFIR